MTECEDKLIGGTHDGEWVKHDGCPFIRMMPKVKRPVFMYTYGRHTNINHTFEPETYSLRSFAFRHHGLWCKTQAYVLDSISDEEAVKLLNTRDTQQDW